MVKKETKKKMHKIIGLMSDAIALVNQQQSYIPRVIKFTVSFCSAVSQFWPWSKYGVCSTWSRRRTLLQKASEEKNKVGVCFPSANFFPGSPCCNGQQSTWLRFYVGVWQYGCVSWIYHAINFRRVTNLSKLSFPFPHLQNETKRQLGSLVASNRNTFT